MKCAARYVLSSLSNKTPQVFERDIYLCPVHFSLACFNQASSFFIQCMNGFLGVAVGGLQYHGGLPEKTLIARQFSTYRAFAQGSFRLHHVTMWTECRCKIPRLVLMRTQQ